MDNCNLCLLYEKRQLPTRIYGETDKVIVVESYNKDGAKKRMMAVLKRHTNSPTQEEKEAVLNVLDIEARKFGDNFEIEEFSSAYGHYHRHARF